MVDERDLQRLYQSKEQVNIMQYYTHAGKRIVYSEWYLVPNTRAGLRLRHSRATIPPERVKKLRT